MRYSLPHDISAEFWVGYEGRFINSRISETNIPELTTELTWWDILDQCSTVKATVKAGALSDGCSPTIKTKRFGTLGPWNGPIDIKTNLPVTYRAFFLHDVLLRYKHMTGMTAQECNDVFCKEIMKTDFVFRRQYAFMVKHFGPKK